MQAILKSERLTLRPFTLNDAKQVQLLAGDKRISDMTANIPHPYEDGIAEQWISSHRENYENNNSIAYAIVEQSNGVLMGAISLMYRSQDQAELGYWLGVPYWGNGYTTEAARTLLEFADKELALDKITACHLPENKASGRVILKSGFRYIDDRNNSNDSKARNVKYYER